MKKVFEMTFGLVHGSQACHCKTEFLCTHVVTHYECCTVALFSFLPHVFAHISMGRTLCFMRVGLETCFRRAFSGKRIF